MPPFNQPDTRQFLANQARPSAVLSTDMMLDKDQAQQIRDRWNEQAKSLHQGGVPSCAIVRSFFMAARATFALKAGEWFRRARFFIFAPDSQANHACRQAEIPLNALFKIPEPPQPS